MSSKCTLGKCFAPDLSCSIGEARLEDCPHWQASVAAVAGEPEQDALAGEPDEVRFPWTGNAMGAADLSFLAGSLKTRLVALMGAENAGKTSLLAAFYLLVARGICPDDVSFSGSLTLEGWENIASTLRWSTPQGPAFPPHTSSGAGRRPGLLHMSFRLEGGSCELLAGDAPGEWFSSWAVSRDKPQAEGARWLSAYSDVILVMADSHALSGSQRGVARQALIDLLRRVGAEARGRPVALVWTKCDISVPQEIMTSVEDAAMRSLGTHQVFRVSMHPAPGSEHRNRGQGIVELLQWVVKVQETAFEFPALELPERALLQTFGGLDAGH